MSVVPRRTSRGVCLPPCALGDEPSCWRFAAFAHLIQIDLARYVYPYWSMVGARRGPITVAVAGRHARRRDARLRQPPRCRIEQIPLTGGSHTFDVRATDPSGTPTPLRRLSRGPSTRRSWTRRSRRIRPRWLRARARASASPARRGDLRLPARRGGSDVHEPAGIHGLAAGPHTSRSRRRCGRPDGPDTRQLRVDHRAADRDAGIEGQREQRHGDGESVLDARPGSRTAGTVSADGRYVVFTSNATNLVAGQVDDANGNPSSDVFLYDRVARDNDVGEPPSRRPRDHPDR